MRTRARLLSTLFTALLLALIAGIGWPPRAVCTVAQNEGPSEAALAAGLRAQQRHRAQVRNAKLWTLIDYELPFTSVRLWVLDARRDNAVKIASRVSHAWNSGALYATTFSNTPGSELSSLGSFVTMRQPYDGGYGRSLRVRGLDRGENDKALARAIIFHPDLGMTHSAGCFMLPEAVARRVVDMIAGGSFVYVHGPRQLAR
jgi:L,D-transpeptidase catalytic domain